MLYCQSRKQIFQVNPLLVSCLVLILNVAFSSLIFLVLFPEPEYGNSLVFDSRLEEFLIVVVFVPLLETLIFQSWILKWLFNSTKRKWLSILLGAVFFGISHWYSVPYVFKTFLSGIMYNTLYLVTREQSRRAFWYVAFTHMAFNLIAFIWQ